MFQNKLRCITAAALIALSVTSCSGHNDSTQEINLSDRETLSVSEEAVTTVDETEAVNVTEEEVDSLPDIDPDAEYRSDVMQQVGDRVYYCSSDDAPEILNVPVLDFSEVKPDYIKVTAADGSSISSFCIYGDKIYYISDYGFRDYYKGPYSFGNLYVSDLSGDNKKLLEPDVSGLNFLITNGNLYFNMYENFLENSNSVCYAMNLDTGEVKNSEKQLGNLTYNYTFRFKKTDNEYVELDGGYYYVEWLSEMRQINGHNANEIFMRKDKATGVEEEVGYNFSQVH